MAEAKVKVSGGVGFFGLLAVAFIVLKLCHVIEWSWWWVLAPIWGWFALFLVALFVALLVVFVMHGFRK